MIIFMGVAGSGKSTQAGMLAQELDCQRLGVGDLLRMNMDGAQAKKMLAGEMVNDDILLPLLGKENAITERFNEYRNTIEPILSYLRKEGFEVHDIDGERAPGAVDKDIKKVLGITHK
jgi:adenylate kinase family enzyme